MTSHDLPPVPPAPPGPADLGELEQRLSEPRPNVRHVIAHLPDPLIVLGSGGKMGTSLVGMACRARDQLEGARDDLRIISVSRFSNEEARQAQEAYGAETIRCDLLDPDAVSDLPDAASVIYMVGLKFGTGDNPSLTWAVNTLAPAYAARRFRGATWVAFSTGNVYPMTPVERGGSVESDELNPIGEYANAAIARERVLDYHSRTYGTPMALVRLNYALEPRYGVLVDLAQAVLSNEPIDLSMGYFNGIWQADANAAAIRLLEHATTPPTPFNVTGAQTLPVRDIAQATAERLGKTAHFIGEPAPTALLSNASKCHDLLGPPETPIDHVIAWVCDWVAQGGKTLGKPTHFQTRDGRY